MSGSGSTGFVVFVPFVVIPTLTPTLNLTLNPTPPSTFQRTTFNLQPPQLTPPPNVLKTMSRFLHKSVELML